jgi:hypothetical protein
MTNWLIFAEQVGSVGGSLPFLSAIVAGIFSIVTALITAFAPIWLVREKAAVRRRGGSDPTSKDEGEVQASAGPKAEVVSPTGFKTTSALLMICGLVLVLWGGYALVKIQQLDVTIAGKDKEINDIKEKIVNKEKDFEQLRQSFSKSSGVVFKSVNVKSEYTFEDGKRLYYLWVEADREILKQINHVKYVFSDNSWKASPVLLGEEPNLDGRRHFRCGVYSRQAITYITVLIMYEGYKENGAIQPINFHWRDEARAAE